MKSIEKAHEKNSILIGSILAPVEISHAELTPRRRNPNGRSYSKSSTCLRVLHNLKPLIQAVHFMKICGEKILSAVTLLIIQSVLVGAFALLTSLRILRSKTTPLPPCVSSSAQLKTDYTAFPSIFLDSKLLIRIW